VKVVTTNGVFDILHEGHLHILREARKLGDKLIVLINSDESVRKLKGECRPINNQKFRCDMLRELRCVDTVYIFDEPDPCKFIESIKPDIHVKSKSGYKGLEKETLAKYGGKLVLLDDVPSLSTTNIIDRCMKIFYYGEAKTSL